MTEIQFVKSCAPFNSIFDTHAHYDDERFDDVRDEVFSALEKFGVCGVINNSVDDVSAAKIAKMAEKYPICYSAFGYHPGDLPDCEPDLTKIEPFFDTEKCVAVGEIGLDYYWTQDNKDLQKRWFAAQCDFANARNLPVIVHDREAHEDTLCILKDLKPRGVLHCYSGSVETAKELLKLGMYIGIGGVSTFKNAKRVREVIKEVPLERILLETDAPYLAPEPYRSKTCHSGMIIRVAEKIAEIKNTDTDTVLSVTKQNTFNLFNIK